MTAPGEAYAVPDPGASFTRLLDLKQIHFMGQMTESPAATPEEAAEDRRRAAEDPVYAEQSYIESRDKFDRRRVGAELFARRVQDEYSADLTATGLQATNEGGHSLQFAIVDAGAFVRATQEVTDDALGRRMGQFLAGRMVGLSFGLPAVYMSREPERVAGYIGRFDSHDSNSLWRLSSPESGGSGENIYELVPYNPDLVSHQADELIAHAPDMLATMQRFGTAPEEQNILRSLALAQAEGLQFEWAIATDLNLLQPYNPNKSPTENREWYRNSIQWEAVCMFLEDLAARARPGSAFARHVRDSLLTGLENYRQNSARMAESAFGEPLPSDIAEIEREAERLQQVGQFTSRLSDLEKALQLHRTAQRVAELFPENF